MNGDTQSKDHLTFENLIRSLEAEIANVGVHLAIDASARRSYVRQIKMMADNLRWKANNRRITWAQAAQEAHETRDLIRQIMRGRSTPVGRAIAEQLERGGETLNKLIARKAQELYGTNTVFDRLSSAQQNKVYVEIVKSAGKSNPRVTMIMRRLSPAGRGLIVVSLALSVYTIATADDKTSAAGRELAVTGSGIGGGIAGGALAGLACGPGAPVCVALGAFVGGALAAFGVSFIW